MNESNFKKQGIAICAFMVLAAVSLSTSCIGKSSRAKEAQVFATAVEIIDQPYGDHDRQKFNIYLPEGRSTETTPVLFLIHGGAWTAGDKEGCKFLIDAISADLPQFAFVSVGYRLVDGKTQTNQFPTQEEDIKACVEYVMDNRAEYGISDRFAIFGSSAGAHLAMLYAYKHGPVSHKPAAVINMVGPANLSNIIEQWMIADNPQKELFCSWVTDALGGTENTELYHSSSPINFITPDSSPTLMLYGEDDQLVLRAQADELDAKLTQNGVKHKYILYPGQGHDLKDVIPDLLKELKDYLNTYL
jgi:acetyl esterase/lipase